MSSSACEKLRMPSEKVMSLCETQLRGEKMIKDSRLESNRRLS
jgi:hypothetical protein